MKTKCFLVTLASLLTASFLCSAYQQDQLLPAGSDMTPFVLHATESQIVAVDFKPFAIRVGTDSTRLTVEIEDDGVEEIWIANLHGIFSRSGAVIDTLVLRDDGTQGDAVPNDNIFTIDSLYLTATENDLYEPAYFINASSSVFTLVYEDGRIIEDPHRGYYIGVMSENLSFPSIYQKEGHDDLLHTEYVVGLTSTSGAYNHVHDVSGKYYSILPDDRDFLLVSMLMGPLRGGGSFRIVRNDVKGIGRSVFDNSPSYGSNGRLQGIVRLLPSPNFGLLNHEILHRWGVYLDKSLDLEGGGSHWGIIERPSTGFGHSSHGAYHTIEPTGGNEYRALTHSGWRDASLKEFNDLELYLMGLIEYHEIESPVRTLANPTSPRPLRFEGEWVNSTWLSYGIFEADSIRKVTVEEIVDVHGLRTPGPEHAQTAFSSAMIVVHNRPLLPVELAFYDYHAREYEKEATDIPHRLTFEEATGGRATMATRLFDPLPPNPLVLKCPEDGESVPAPDVTFSWEPLSGVECYHIQVAHDEYFSDLYAEQTSLENTLVLIGGMTSNQEYYWRARAINQGGSGEWSETRSFFTLISIVVDVEGGGTVTGYGTYTEGAQVTLQAIPDEGHHFVHWTEKGEVVLDGDEPAGEVYSFMAEEARDLVAQFAINVYAVEAAANNLNYGTITGAGEYEHGQTATLTAISNDSINYVFLNWTEDGTEVHDLPTYSFTVTSARDLCANFQNVTLVSYMDDISGIKIYPVPVGEVLMIKSETVLTYIRLVDLSGNVHHSGGVNDKKYSLDVSKFPEGVYILLAETKRGLSANRLIIVR